MDVKFCDGCKEPIDGMYFTVDRERTDDRPIYDRYMFTIGRQHWPKDTHLRPSCIIAALEGEVESGIQEA